MEHMARYGGDPATAGQQYNPYSYGMPPMMPPMGMNVSRNEAATTSRY